MYQMPTMRGNRNKRRIADDDDDSDFEIPQSKKQITSDEGGTPVHVKKNGHKQAAIIDLESYAVPRKLVCKGDGYRQHGFPRFHQGTIYIQLIELHDKYTYIFDKDIIMRSSAKLAEIMGVRLKEADSCLAETIKQHAGLEFFFDLKYVPKVGGWALVGAVSIPLLVSDFWTCYACLLWSFWR